MNATELYLKDGKSAAIFYCEKCRMIARSQHLAEQCCTNYLCSKCGQDTGGRTWLVCELCRSAADAEQERQRFNKAEKITQWGGWVYDGSDFYESVEEMLDAYETNDAPEYVWTCQENHFAVADVSAITERILDNAYEDFDSDDLKGLDALAKAITDFNEANKDVVSYEPNYKLALVLATSVDASTATLKPQE